MTPKDYVIWLKGFVEACHEYAPTPKQWDALKDKLKEVNNPIGITGVTTSTTARFPSGSSIYYTNTK